VTGVTGYTGARTLFPQIQPLDYATAVTLALARIEKGAVETI
jgi:hypothetical protein